MIFFIFFKCCQIWKLKNHKKFRFSPLNQGFNAGILHKYDLGMSKNKQEWPSQTHKIAINNCHMISHTKARQFISIVFYAVLWGSGFDALQVLMSTYQNISLVYDLDLFFVLVVICNFHGIPRIRLVSWFLSPWWVDRETGPLWHLIMKSPVWIGYHGFHHRYGHYGKYRADVSSFQLTVGLSMWQPKINI